MGSAGASLALGQTSLASQAEREIPSKPLTLAGQPVQMWFTPVSAHTMRISLLPVLARGGVQRIPDSIVLASSQWSAPVKNLESVTRPVRVPWKQASVLVSPAPLRIAIKSRSGETIQQIKFDAESGAVRFSIGSRPVYGLGEGGPQFDRRGSLFRMSHGERVRDLATDGARMSIPWLIGTGGWALFFHTPSGSVDLSGKDGLFAPRPGGPSLPLDIFLVVSDRPHEILAEYARLTGSPHMPPVWALGYQQSHRTLSNRDDVMAETATFRQKKLPCDVMIYLGTGFCPSGWNMGHGSYDFNPRVFPDPAGMINEMHRRHFRIVLHEDKPPRQLHGRASDTGAAAKDPEDAAYYWKEHLKVFNLGVDGWWADEGDWLDHISCLVRDRMYWEGSQLSRPNARPYTLNRNGYAGIQRYGWLWSGDIRSSWQTLRDQIAVGLNIGLSGMPYWGTDTGGFVTTPELTGELYVRWFQFSAFCPLFRSHGRTWKLRLPWGWDTGSYGPIEGPESSLPPLADLHNPAVEPVCRKYLDLRYRLLPYLYAAVREAHDTGLPIMRALWLHYPDDPRAVERNDEYLWGPSLLVAPVTEAGARTRKLYLPRGTWYDFWTEEMIEGGREIVRPVDLVTMPIYARAGAIVPMGPVKQYTTEEATSPISLVVYPGTNGDTYLYEDDGITFNFLKGDFARTQLSWTDQKRRLTLSLAGAWSGYRSTKRFEARLAKQTTLRWVAFDGKTASIDL